MVVSAAPVARIPASPLARRLAREAGLPLDGITGTGPDGRVIRRDVEAAVRDPVVTPYFSVRGTARVGKLLKLLRRLEDSGVAMTVLPVVLKAAAHASRQTLAVTVDLSVTLHGGTLVLREADRRSLTSIAAALDAPDASEPVGGVMTVLALDAEEFTAPVVPPQRAALAVGAVRREPVVGGDGRLKARHVMRVTLSADPRAIDVTAATAWMAAFLALLADPVRVLA
ncbi:hypothetical protein GCM10009850_009150 [Nonomuraea monospora]|uniref:Peripheral subunit-binding (PSBD) domain-containing protein n=1 Tax=Nonomuraea monospora TaxID=568818 RepID=A0ABP5P0T4_9ACTN